MCKVSGNLLKEGTRERDLTECGHKKEEDLRYRKRLSVKEGVKGTPRVLVCTAGRQLGAGHTGPPGQPGAGLMLWERASSGKHT